MMLRTMSARCQIPYDSERESRAWTGEQVLQGSEECLEGISTCPDDCSGGILGRYLQNGRRRKWTALKDQETSTSVRG